MSELKVQSSMCESSSMVQIDDIRQAFVTRLRNAAREAGIPEWGLGAKLATITGKTPKAASKWLNGEAMPTRSAMVQIAEALNVRTEWLQYGKGFPIASPHYSFESNGPGGGEVREQGLRPAIEPQRTVRRYPLISWVAAGAWAEACDNYAPGDGEEFIESFESAGAHGYWLEVGGDSMVPPDGFAFHEGMRILVQPEGFDVISGKLYIAKLMPSGETTFKQYVRDAGVEYLKPLNPSYKTLIMDDNVRLIGRVIDARPPRSIF